MKVDIEHNPNYRHGDITTIKFSNKNVTTIDELRFIISAVCSNYCFIPCIFDDEWGFETWFNSIDQNGKYKQYKVVCGYSYDLDEKYICDWY